MDKVPLVELENRMEQFKKHMDIHHPQWEIAIIFSNINLYYFTGTMQDGMLVILKDKEPTFWVRKSYERALDESLFKDIKYMRSFRDAASTMEYIPDEVFLEMEIIPLGLYARLNKHFPFKSFKGMDKDIAFVRAVKSKYELKWIKKSGKIHEKVLEDITPGLLYEGMSEADLALKLFSALVNEGHDGVTRFGMFDTEILVGHVGFGKSSIYPTYFDGASGNYGLSPAAPVFGSRHRKLKNGDLVFVDVGCAVNGYNTDKTMTYMFGKSLPQFAIDAHNKCVEIQDEIASLLKPGAIPSNIYRSVMERLDSDFLKNFMGYKDRRVKFLGHGIGLQIDELPVIAEGFNMPLKEGMVFAIEPKKGIKGIGMVGIENTFIVTSHGGKCVTGNSKGLIQVL